MIPDSKAFNGKDYFEYDGKRFFRWYYLKDKTQYTLKLKFVSVNSPHAQGIALFFSDFKGSIYLNGERLNILKRFKHYVFKERELSNKDIILNIKAEEGYIFFSNASEYDELSVFECGAAGCAFWIEELSDNQLRFHCNDHDMDDDFDDLIFDMEIIM